MVASGEIRAYACKYVLISLAYRDTFTTHHEAIYVASVTQGWLVTGRNARWATMGPSQAWTQTRRRPG
jgi:hypothetical protein